MAEFFTEWMANNVKRPVHKLSGAVHEEMTTDLRNVLEMSRLPIAADGIPMCDRGNERRQHATRLMEFSKPWRQLTETWAIESAKWWCGRYRNWAEPCLKMGMAWPIMVTALP
jgi:hypothetical protein